MFENRPHKASTLSPVANLGPKPESNCEVQKQQAMAELQPLNAHHACSPRNPKAGKQMPGVDTASFSNYRLFSGNGSGSERAAQGSLQRASGLRRTTLSPEQHP